MWYVWRRRKMNTGFWWGTLTGRKKLEQAGVGGRINQWTLER
jgi:hypothetical protein